MHKTIKSIIITFKDVIIFVRTLLIKTAGS